MRKFIKDPNILKAGFETSDTFKLEKIV